jgi:hypothetical protein
MDVVSTCVVAAASMPVKPGCWPPTESALGAGLEGALAARDERRDLFGLQREFDRRGLAGGESNAAETDE